ncbi:uncharacterized protein BDV17DRAFT_74794 [Aspergillus undulatus]|uniref:uncharacterized protein n=1 Tax=Aspergillus undulatus TaxID=1810928 RepID=UPI003CCE356D
MDTNNSGNGVALPYPILSLRLYRRCFKGSKQLFSDSDAAPASYFVTNPVPHKHSDTWKPIFYRGDNPKYTPESTAIGRARRSGMWGSFRVWLGDGVQEVLNNEDLRRKRRKGERKNKWRKRFGKDARPIEVEDEKVVQGKVVMFRMQRAGFLHRRVEWEFDGVRYRWSGTRMFAKGLVRHAKGWSHSMKLIRMSDHALIATFDKRPVWSQKTVKTGRPPNKCKTTLGILRLYNYSEANIKDPLHWKPSKLTSMMAQVDAAGTGPTDIKNDEKDLNPHGSHSGNIMEAAIVFSCYIVIEAEHRLRAKVPDFLSEVAENIEGG